MFWVVYGGSGSGKSQFAETLAVKLKGTFNAEKLIYIAAMKPYGDEGKRRIEKHRKMRFGKGFETVECYSRLKDIKVYENSVVLLECMSNLAANEMFDEKNDSAAEDIIWGIKRLVGKCRAVIAVTNDIFSDGVSYDEATTEYIRLLADINVRMAEAADRVSEIICAKEIRLKG